MKLHSKQSPGPILGFCVKAGLLGMAWLAIAGYGVNFLSLALTLTCEVNQFQPTCRLSKARLVNTPAIDDHDFILYDAQLETHESSSADSIDTYGIVLTTSEGQVKFSPFFESSNSTEKQQKIEHIQQFLNNPSQRSLKLWSGFVELFWITGSIFTLIILTGIGIVVYRFSWLLSTGQEAAYWSWQKHSARLQELQISPEAKVYRMPDRKGHDPDDTIEAD